MEPGTSPSGDLGIPFASDSELTVKLPDPSHEKEVDRRRRSARLSSSISTPRHKAVGTYSQDDEAGTNPPALSDSQKQTDFDSEYVVITASAADRPSILRNSLRNSERQVDHMHGTSLKRKQLRFGAVHQFYFAFQEGSHCVPRCGGYPLGMTFADDPSLREITSVDDLECLKADLASRPLEEQRVVSQGRKTREKLKQRHVASRPSSASSMNLESSSIPALVEPAPAGESVDSSVSVQSLTTSACSITTNNSGCPEPASGCDRPCLCRGSSECNCSTDDGLGGTGSEPILEEGDREGLGKEPGGTANSHVKRLTHFARKEVFAMNRVVSEKSMGRDLHTLRVQRKNVGCQKQCVNGCVPATCPCARSEIGCLVDSPGWPCSCGVKCQNPWGRYAFDPEKITELRQPYLAKPAPTLVPPVLAPATPAPTVPASSAPTVPAPSAPTVPAPSAPTVQAPSAPVLPTQSGPGLPAPILPTPALALAPPSPDVVAPVVGRVTAQSGEYLNLISQTTILASVTIPAADVISPSIYVRPTDTVGSQTNGDAVIQATHVAPQLMEPFPVPVKSLSPSLPITAPSLPIIERPLSSPTETDPMVSPTTAMESRIASILAVPMTPQANTSSELKAADNESPTVALGVPANLTENFEMIIDPSKGKRKKWRPDLSNVVEGTRTRGEKQRERDETKVIISSTLALSHSLPPTREEISKESTKGEDVKPEISSVNKSSGIESQKRRKTALASTTNVGLEPTVESTRMTKPPKLPKERTISNPVDRINKPKRASAGRWGSRSARSDGTVPLHPLPPHSFALSTRTQATKTRPLHMKHATMKSQVLPTDTLVEPVDIVNPSKQPAAGPLLTSAVSAAIALLTSNAAKRRLEQATVFSSPEYSTLTHPSGPNLPALLAFLAHAPRPRPPPAPNITASSGFQIPRLKQLVLASESTGNLS